MAKLTRDEVLKLAGLSRLKLTEEEIERFSVELTAILDYVAELDKVDTTGLKPTYQVTGLKNVTRPDEVAKYQATPQDVMALAPAAQGGNYKVKKVL
jgi:aspartyl-tRNA(Asn)/glutamyl-tRNA(Gln) amidotransferase subunit C